MLEWKELEMANLVISINSNILYAPWLNSSFVQLFFAYCWDNGQRDTSDCLNTIWISGMKNILQHLKNISIYYIKLPFVSFLSFPHLN